jgi:phospholipid/cholesterol/gamma-HCH transport system permease protein
MAPERTDWFSRLGERLLTLGQGIGGGLALLARAVWWCRAVPANADKVVAQLAEIGNATLPIAAIMALFVGGVLALQTGVELAQFGVQGTLGGIVGLSMARELGPVMTALLVAGRVGSAMAAELGAMSVYEEIDALRTLDIDPVRYLVMPRLVASVLALPCLVVYADLLGWLGGALVASANQRIQVDFHAFFSHLREVVAIGDIGNGLAKAVVFGAIVAVVSCQVGLETRGGPREIGRSVTRAVVFSFIFIFVFDYVMTRLLM